MPQLQALSAIPSLGERLGEALGTGTQQGLSQLLSGFQEQKKSRSQLQALTPFLKEAGLELNPEQEESLINSGLKPDLIVPLAQTMMQTQSKERALQAKELEKKQTEAKEQQEKVANVKGIQNVINEMGRMIIEDLPGIGISAPAFLRTDPDAVRNRNKFNAMRPRLESILAPMVGKGAMTKERFKFILESVPKGNETQAAMIGKLEGLAEILGEAGIPLDVSILQQFGQKKSKELTPSKSIGESNQYKEGQTAKDKQGNRVIFKGGTWVPVQ